MRYLGGKSKLAKYILPYIMPHIWDYQYYVEPFCGSCAVLEKIQCIKRIAADSNYYLIEMWKAVQNGWLPPKNISEELYTDIKNNKSKYPPELVSFVGFGCSFGGKFFRGFARGVRRNFAKESYNKVIKSIPAINDVLFIHTDYQNLWIPDKSIIYCDPPYINTEKYKHNIDHKEFWIWCEQRALEGHLVFVSEQSHPPNFFSKILKTRKASTTIGTSSKYIKELLIVHKSQAGYLF